MNEKEAQREYDHGYKVYVPTNHQKDFLRARIMIYQAEQQMKQERNEEKYRHLREAGFTFL